MLLTPLQPSIKIESDFQKELIGVAKHFNQLYPGVGFVPCTSNLKGKKIPLKGAENWQSGKYKYKDIESEDFSRITMLSIVLGKEFLAIDCDGLSAIEKLNELDLNLPETLIISSTPGYRCCYIFKLSGKSLEYSKIDTGNKEQLEFRTGDQYQVIAGIHPTTKKPYFTNNMPILDLPDNVYKFLKAENKKEYIEELPFLQYFISASDRQLINSGAENNRNDQGIKLALNLIGTENRLKELDIDHQETSEELFYKYCLACDQTDWNESEWQTIYKSALKKNPEPCYDDDYLKDLKKAWNCDYGLEENIQKISQNITLSKFATLQESLEKYRNRNFDSSEIHIRANEIFENSFKRNPGYADKEIIENIINELSTTELNDEEIFTINSAIESVRKSEDSKLDVRWILQDLNIFYSIEQYSVDNNIPIENLLISFLTVVSSLITKKTSFNFNTDGKTHANIFTVFVGAATSGKSISVDPFKRVLSQIAVETNNSYIQELEIYEQELNDWKSLSKQEKEARYLQVSGLYELDESISATQKREAVITKPVKKHPYIISDASFEAIAQLSGQHNKYGLLITPDEVTDFIQGIDRINKQQKTGLNQLIAVWNGSETLKNRSSQQAQIADYYRCSLLSTIQTDRFYEQFDINDSSGIVSRFLLIPITKPVRPPSKLITQKPEFDLIKNLKEYYNFLQSRLNPEQEIIVKQSEKSHKFWASYRKQLEDRCDAILEVNQGFAQWLNRQPLQCARLALIIHFLRWSEDVEDDLTIMSDASMIRAIAISRWLTEKASLLFRQTLTQKTETLDQDKVFIFEEFQRHCEKICQKNNSKTVKVSDFTSHAFMRKKIVLKNYSKDKKAKYLKKPEIISLFIDFSKCGVAEYVEGCLNF